MSDWFTSRVLFLSIHRKWNGRKWNGVYLYIHFLPRRCYRLFWDVYRGFGADSYLKAKYVPQQRRKP